RTEDYRAGAVMSYSADISADQTWLATQCQADGAIQYTTSKINPYFGNLAARGMLDPTSPQLALVKKWIQWYIAHLNIGTDPWGTGTDGTICDYHTSGGVTGSSFGTADSTDSYAATFLTVVWNYYNAPGADQAYIASIQTQLDNIGKAAIYTQDSDGLTWALPTFHIKYLEDNSE